MVRAGISLPALQQLMGHSNIHTTMLYVHLAPQDVWREYARAVQCRSRRKTGPFWRVKRSHGVGYAMAFCRAEKAVGVASCYFLSFFAASASAAC